jgi:hypothetical protein
MQRNSAVVAASQNLSKETAVINRRLMTMGFVALAMGAAALAQQNNNVPAAPAPADEGPGLDLVYHLTAVNQTLRFTPEAISEIFLGKITQWDDERIATLNPGIRLPNMMIVVIYRREVCQATLQWTTWLANESPSWRSSVGSGRVVKWPLGLQGRGIDGVVGTLKEIDGSLSYLEADAQLPPEVVRGSIIARGASADVAAAQNAPPSSEQGPVAAQQKVSGPKPQCHELGEEVVQIKDARPSGTGHCAGESDFWFTNTSPQAIDCAIIFHKNGRYDPASALTFTLSPGEKSGGPGKISTCGADSGEMQYQCFPHMENAGANSCAAQAQWGTTGTAQDAPPPPKPAAEGPTLEVTMKFIQDKLNGIGPVNFAQYNHDNAIGSEGTNQYRFEVSKVVADPRACRIDYHAREDAEGNVTNDDSPWLVLKSVDDITIVPMEQFLKEVVTAAGHPSYSFRVDPAVFMLKVRVTGVKGSYNFYFFSEDLADRIAKAMKHASELCRAGKKESEPF